MTDLHLWPIFICYRRVDGGAAAHRLKETLDKVQIEDGTQPIQLDVYLDQEVPGVADWKAIHGPYFERARAMIVVCTPGAKLNEGPADFVHQEIDWWVAHRNQAPILIDPLMEGARYVPSQIAERWPDIQRIPLVESEWSSLSGDGLEAKTDALRRLIVGAILPSGAAIYKKEVDDERERAERLSRMLKIVVVLLVVAAVTAAVAWWQWRTATLNQQIADASRLDATATSLFAEAGQFDSRRELEMNRRADLVAELAAIAPSDVPTIRESNLRDEIAQTNRELKALAADSGRLRSEGRTRLSQANAAWSALKGRTPLADTRRAPGSPDVLSIELLNAGFGESILVHYGTPEDTKLVMINGGPRTTFKTLVEPRLRDLSLSRFDGRPVPIQLFVVGDRDEEKTGGLLALIESGAADIRGVWDNLFRGSGGRPSFRGTLRDRIDSLRVPVNKPFNHHVMRPERGRAEVVLPGGLEIVVLGPDLERLRALHKFSTREAEQRDGALNPLADETFRNVTVGTEPAPLSTRDPAPPPGECMPSANAQAFATATYRDNSVSNLASTILLFRYKGRSFLFTGDARGDLIVNALSGAGLLDADGRASVDLMTIPHLGSEHNVNVDLFRRVKADGYLFSGDGRFDNPSVATVASLVAARGCDTYRMYFVNRDTSTRSSVTVRAGEDSHGVQLDAFFRREAEFKSNYRRVFRSTAGGSVIINLLHPIRY